MTTFVPSLAGALLFVLLLLSSSSKEVTAQQSSPCYNQNDCFSCINTFSDECLWCPSSFISHTSGFCYPASSSSSAANFCTKPSVNDTSQCCASNGRDCNSCVENGNCYFCPYDDDPLNPKSYCTSQYFCNQSKTAQHGGPSSPIISDTSQCAPTLPPSMNCAMFSDNASYCVRYLGSCSWCGDQCVPSNGASCPNECYDKNYRLPMTSGVYLGSVILIFIHLIITLYTAIQKAWLQPDIFKEHFRLRWAKIRFCSNIVVSIYAVVILSMALSVIKESADCIGDEEVHILPCSSTGVTCSYPAKCAFAGLWKRTCSITSGENGRCDRSGIQVWGFYVTAVVFYTIGLLTCDGCQYLLDKGGDESWEEFAVETCYKCPNMCASCLGACCCCTTKNDSKGCCANTCCCCLEKTKYWEKFPSRKEFQQILFEAFPAIMLFLTKLSMSGMLEPLTTVVVTDNCYHGSSFGLTLKLFFAGSILCCLIIACPVLCSFCAAFQGKASSWTSFLMYFFTVMAIFFFIFLFGSIVINLILMTSSAVLGAQDFFASVARVSLTSLLTGLCRLGRVLGDFFVNWWSHTETFFKTCSCAQACDHCSCFSQCFDKIKSIQWRVPESALQQQERAARAASQHNVGITQTVAGVMPAIGGAEGIIGAGAATGAETLQEKLLEKEKQEAEARKKLLQKSKDHQSKVGGYGSTNNNKDVKTFSDRDNDDDDDAKNQYKTSSSINFNKNDDDEDDDSDKASLLRKKNKNNNKNSGDVNMKVNPSSCRKFVLVNDDKPPAAAPSPKTTSSVKKTPPPPPSAQSSKSSVKGGTARVPPKVSQLGGDGDDDVKMVFCGQCGKKIQANHKFCKFCGSRND